MLHPSYTDLMRVVNKDIEEGETMIVNSRYSIVLATSKRARQIIDGSNPLVPAKPGEKPLSIAIDELNSEKLKILAENTGEDYDIESLIEEFEAEEKAATSAVEKEAVEDAHDDIDIDSLIEDYTDE